MHGNDDRAARGTSALAAATLGAGLLLLSSCVVLPVKIGPAVDGQVVDQASGKPLADAVVVVRFDGRYDDVLPDRDLIGHQEARTDASGRFRMDRLVRPGISAWPLFRTEARVVGVMHAGYRCAAPRAIPESGSVRITLTPALDDSDRRDSCRPVTAERGEVTAYMDAWRTLFADAGAQGPNENDRQVERLLAARTALGFGENCAGPVTDLAVSPGGARAAVRIAGQEGGRLERIELSTGAQQTMKAPASARGDARLAWVADSELVLIDPGEASASAFTRSSLATGRWLRLWSGDTAPAAPAPGAGSPAHAPSFDPANLSDESDRRWLGRTFSLARRLDPESGLPVDELRVTREDRSRTAFLLPGEACGADGRFGRPHYRMSADGRSGLDLRFVDGGCHAVRIDLETGAWKKLDTATAPAQCTSARQVPAANLYTALRSYMREVETALVEGGADPVAAFVLQIAEDGETHAQARDFAGDRHSIRVPRFPVRTPLRRIDVSTVGLVRPAAPGAIDAASQPEPL